MLYSVRIRFESGPGRFHLSELSCTTLVDLEFGAAGEELLLWEFELM